jgi:hypothetical protein
LTRRADGIKGRSYCCHKTPSINHKKMPTIAAN